MTARGYVWRSPCGNGACVEVAADGDTVLIRDSKNPAQAPLRFTPDEWWQFRDAMAAGAFDDVIARERT